MPPKPDKLCSSSYLSLLSVEVVQCVVCEEQSEGSGERDGAVVGVPGA